MDIEQRGENYTDDVSRLTAELRALETDIQAAILAEPEPVETRTEETPETREIDDLQRRSSITGILNEAVTGRDANGPEHELRAAFLGESARAGLLPLDMLDTEPLERRADVATTVDAAALADGSQAPIASRVFSRSIAARLGVSMPTVPVGATNFPVMLTGASASMAVPGAQVSAEAATFTGFTLEPVRLSARYKFRIEDAAKLRGYEAALRRDLAAVMSDAMDNQIVNGDGTSPNVNGFLNELTAPADPTAVTDYAQYKSAITSLVDGLNAYQLSEIRVVLGAACYQLGEISYRTATGGDLSVVEHLTGRVGGLSVSSRIPAPASKIQTNIAAKTAYPGRNAVAPIWRALEIIRDPYSDSDAGEVSLTAIALWNFKIVREAGWALFKIRLP